MIRPDLLSFSIQQISTQENPEWCLLFYLDQTDQDQAEGKQPNSISLVASTFQKIHHFAAAGLLLQSYIVVRASCFICFSKRNKEHSHN